MRLKRQYVALIVVVMLIVTAVLVSMLSQYAQGGRIAYVSVKADKTTFAEGENVSFSFVPMTPGVEFSTSGIDSGYGMSYGIAVGSVHIVHIPDNVDPDQIIQDRKMMDKISSWDNRDMMVLFDYFNSSDGTKSLSWNGTQIHFTYDTAHQNSNPSVTYSKALGGYYLIYPQFTPLSGHPVKFQLDRNAIFFLDSLKMTSVPTMNGSMVNYDVTFSAPASLSGVSHCNFTWSINGMTSGIENGSYSQAEFDLTPGGSHSLTIAEMGYVQSEMQIYHLAGWIDTAWGNYTFDRWDYHINGGWYDSPQYFYYY